MKNKYLLNKIKIKRKKAKEKELKEETKRVKITEREYDEAILGGIDTKVRIINHLEDEITNSIKIYKDKIREKGYNEMRLTFYKEEGMVWYDVVPKKVGFFRND